LLLLYTSHTFAKKFLIMRFIYIAFSCCFIGFVSCNNNGSSTATSGTDSSKHAPVHTEPVKSKLNDTATNMLMAMVTQYYGLKNALVATQAGKADEAARLLLKATDSFNVYLAKDAVNGPALKSDIDSILAQCKLVTADMDEPCEKKRIAFAPISRAVYRLLKIVDIKNAHIYHEFCPMAFNDKGATWLSDESEIKNPYFGKKMMECGEVTDSL
jgi:Protein of unknown function (DUF3347)